MHLTPPTLDQLDRLRREIERTCRAVAPADLAGRPLYVVFASQLATETAGDHLYGCTLHSLHLIARPHLDAWEGRGPAFMVNDRAIFADAATLNAGRPTPTSVDFVATCRAIAMHEFAHLLERGCHRGPAPAPAVLREIRDVFCSASEGRDATAAEPLPVAIDRDHGPAWIRLAIHATWRANRHAGGHGCFASYEDVTGNAGRGLSPTWDYREALAGEPERMAAASFAEILAAPAPDAFTTLWESDVARLIAAASAAAAA